MVDVEQRAHGPDAAPIGARYAARPPTLAERLAGAAPHEAGATLMAELGAVAAEISPDLVTAERRRVGQDLQLIQTTLTGILGALRLVDHAPPAPPRPARARGPRVFDRVVAVWGSGRTPGSSEHDPESRRSVIEVDASAVVTLAQRLVELLDLDLAAARALRPPPPELPTSWVAFCQTLIALRTRGPEALDLLLEQLEQTETLLEEAGYQTVGFPMSEQREPPRDWRAFFEIDPVPASTAGRHELVYPAVVRGTQVVRRGRIRASQPAGSQGPETLEKGAQ